MNFGKLVVPEDVAVIYEPTVLTASYKSNTCGRGYISREEIYEDELASVSHCNTVRGCIDGNGMNEDIFNPELIRWNAGTQADNIAKL